MANGILQKRYLDTIAYLVGVLLFFLPFVELKKSSGVVFGEVKTEAKSIKATGTELVFGGSDNSKGNALTSLSNSEVVAMLAFLAGIAGAVLSFPNYRNRGTITAILGVIATICMIVLYTNLKNVLKEPTGFFALLGVSIQVTAWFFLSLFCFAFGALAGFIQRNSVPQNKAPQLDLSMPTDQSEFPRSASESEIG